MSAPVLLTPIEAYAIWAKRYEPRAHNALMRAEQRAMLSLAPACLDGETILDAACGSGRYLLHASDRGAARVIGFDFSPEMLAAASRALSGARVCIGAMLVRATLDAIPLADACVDLSFCGLALGHVDDLAGALTELARVTRPGGLICCSDVHPVGGERGWRREFDLDGQRYAVTWTAHPLTHWRDACAAAGLRIERVLEPVLEPGDVEPEHAMKRLPREPVALALALRHIGGRR